MLAALCVAPGGCAPPSPSVALRGWCVARSGRESRLPDRTGKLDLGHRRLDDSVAFRVEGHHGDRRPVAGLSTPAPRVALPRPLIDRMAGGEQGAILASMTLPRGNVADAAVPVLVVVPVHEARGPLPGGAEVGNG